ncbi:hypothetical protein [Pseudonocardia xishanensis]
MLRIAAAAAARTGGLVGRLFSPPAEAIDLPTYPVGSAAPR